MIITELKVRNFQIHKNLTVKFTKGVNVIIGDTDAGKSALLRALHLLIMNNPRSGESIYQNSYDNKPLSIQIKDDRGNIIRRSKKRYYLNGDLMKAVGTDIPIPIMELFPFNSINWQKQLDQHFLILQTGGGAAKLLNASSGMEDQETLMKNVKSNITEHKSNIKRLILNNKEHDKVITKLRPVSRLLMKAKAIKQLSNQSNELDNEITNLNILIKDIQDHHIDPEVYTSINLLINDITEIDNYQKESITLNHSIKQINDLIIQLKETRKYLDKIGITNILIDSLNSVIIQSKESSNIKIMLNQLFNITDQIKTTQKDIKQFTNELEWLENEFHQKLLEVGECPFCGIKIKKEIV